MTVDTTFFNNGIEVVDRDTFNYWLQQCQAFGAHCDAMKPTKHYHGEKIGAVSWGAGGGLTMFTQRHPFTPNAEYIINWDRVGRFLFQDPTK